MVKNGYQLPVEHREHMRGGDGTVTLRAFLSPEEMHGKNRLFLKLLLSLPIDRDSVSPASVRAIVKPLREGHLIDIFPEGRLNPDPDTLLPFHNGIVLFAKLGSAPLIPVYIDRGSRFWNRIHYVIGEPVSLAELKCERKEDFPRVTALLEEKMAELQALAKETRNCRKEKEQ